MKPRFRYYINEDDVPLDLSVKRFNPVYLTPCDHPLDLASTHRHHHHHHTHHTHHNHHNHHNHHTHHTHHLLIHNSNGNHHHHHHHHLNENENDSNEKSSHSITINDSEPNENDDHQTSLHSPNSDDLNGNCINNRRTSRPLMGKHVRRGTGASPQILSRLKSILQDKQRLREKGLVPSNWKRKKMAKAYN